MFPTLEEMNDRYPHLYQNQPYLRYNANIESTLYIFTCQDNLIKVRNSIIQILKEILQQHTMPQHVSKIIDQKIIKSNLLKVDTSRMDLFEVTPHSSFSITDTLRFLIPKSLTSMLTQELKKPSHQIIPITQKFTDQLMDLLFKI